MLFEKQNACYKIVVTLSPCYCNWSRWRSTYLNEEFIQIEASLADLKDVKDVKKARMDANETMCTAF